MLPYILTNESVTVYSDGKPVVIEKSSPNFHQVCEAIRDDDWDSVEELLNTETAIRTYAGGLVDIKDGTLFYNGKPIHNALVDRILTMMADGYPFEHMVRFFENLQRNPSRTSVQELYLFLEHSMLPITERGTFLAFKAVNSNYKDYHSNSFDNSVGSVVQMPRNEVDDNRDNTCSRGLHFCSQEYSLFLGRGDGHIMVIEIDPADVVSIPSDYGNAKGRTCRYRVVSELHGDPATAFKKNSVVNVQGTVTGRVYSNDGNDNWVTQPRYSDGRFAPKNNVAGS